MLVLGRKENQSIVIGNDIEIKVLEVRGEQVKLGITAPKSVTVHRKEVYDEIQAENLSASEVPADILEKLPSLKKP